ncbi:MAG: PaaI family thioesterase [Thermoplasmatota archaeon]
MPIDPQIRGRLPVPVEAPPVAVLLGMELVAVGAGTSTFFLKADERFHNPMGSVHGGIIGDLADAAMGVAVISTLERDESFTTLEFKMNFLRPVFASTLRAVGRVTHRGRTIAYAEAEVVNGEGKMVAKGTSTNLILKREGEADAFRHHPKDGSAAPSRDARRNGP